MIGKKLSDLITDEYITVDEDDTVEDVRDEWRKSVVPARVGRLIHVTKSNQEFVGLVDVRDLFLEKPKTKISKITMKDVYCISKGDSIQKAVSMVIEKKISELPVLYKNKLCGVVLSEDLLNNMKWENERTFYNLVGIVDQDGKIDLRLKNILGLVKDRSIWLIISAVLSVFLAGGIIAKYESALLLVPMLAVFIPVIMASGGNIGAQTSTIFVRILASKDMDTKRKLPKLFLADLMAGVILGVILGATIGISSIVMFSDYYLGFVLGISMLIISIVAVVIGFAIPIMSNYMGIDPAVTSGPLVTTIKDVVALLIYFFIATSLYL